MTGKRTENQKPKTKLNVLILDGSSSHPGWPIVTAELRATLGASGRFEVDVSTAPPQRSSESIWNAWRPRFSDYDAVISTYEGRMFPEAVREDFESYISAGHGALIAHSSGGQFEGWDAYCEMAALGWRHAGAGSRIFLKDSGEIVSVPPHDGIGPGHGRLHTFQVKNRQPEHPIMKGVPDLWMHGMDELYHGMRGPAKDLTILASAYSGKEQGGTGEHEPVLWTTTFGRGRVVSMVLGHLLDPESIEERLIEFSSEQMAAASLNGTDAVHCVGYQALTVRSVEWAATGTVTIDLPEEFPTPQEASILAPDKVQWVNQKG